MLRFGTRLRSHRTSIRFKDRRDEGKLSQFTLDFLDALATGAGVKHVVVTSTSRTALEQARAMYDKLATGKVDSYRAPGQAVQRVGRQGIDAGQGRSTRSVTRTGRSPVRAASSGTTAASIWPRCSRRRPTGSGRQPEPSHFGCQITYHFLTGFSVSQVPLKPIGMTKPSPMP